MSGKDFVRVFETEYGKIVIMKDQADEGPALCLYAVPDGFGTCNTKLVFEQDDWKALDKAYDTMTKEKVVEWFEVSFQQW